MIIAIICFSRGVVKWDGARRIVQSNHFRGMMTPMISVTLTDHTRHYHICLPPPTHFSINLLVLCPIEKEAGETETLTRFRLDKLLSLSIRPIARICSPSPQSDFCNFQLSHSHLFVYPR